jgi:hypothetical protein
MNNTGLIQQILTYFFHNGKITEEGYDILRDEAGIYTHEDTGDCTNECPDGSGRRLDALISEVYRHYEKEKQ